MPWHEDQSRIGMGFAKLLIDAGGDQVFLELRAASNEDLVLFADLGDLSQFPCFRVVSIGFNAIELYAARDDYVFRVTSKRAEPLGVGFILGGNQGKSFKCTADNPTPLIK